MINNGNRWEKIGRIIGPMENVSWMSTFAGPAVACRIGKSSQFEIIMAGRDRSNRSQIGTFRIDIEEPLRAYDLMPEAILSFGELGAFDENGVSYPWVVSHAATQYLYYNGWMPTVLTPFQIHLGLATRTDGGPFQRVSRAPILERTNDDHLSIGSACVVIEDGLWRMWYTCFTRWGKSPQEHKHYYVIKYAESEDGIHWLRENRTCIDYQGSSEFAICRPSVLKINGVYHMWYSVRGGQYRIGYAWSEDGLSWERRDDLAAIEVSPSGWDSEALCYPHVFEYGDVMYMIHNGNNYGKEGLGIARLRLS